MTKQNNKICNDIQKDKRNLKQWKAKLKKEEKKFGKSKHKIRKEVETVMKKHGVGSAAYHGSDLEGNSIKALMIKAQDIFTKVTAVLVPSARKQMMDKKLILD